MDCPNFLVPPIVSGTGSAIRTSNLAGVFTGSQRPCESPLKIWETRESRRIQGLLKFFQ